MKRAILAFVLLGSSAMFAQARGVPASVTSLGSPTFGPGASVTSLGPNGYNSAPCVFGCFDSRFHPIINFQTGTVQTGGTFNLQNGNRGRGEHHHNRGSLGTYVYAYPYPVPVEVQDQQEEAQPPAEEVMGPPQTIYDRRPVPRGANAPGDEDSRYGEHYLDSRERRQPVKEEPVARVESKPLPEPEPIIVIFKDGHQKEIKNYAIVGDTLYDLGAAVSHKIKLDDVDLKATINKNEERGVEFSLPANLKPKA